MFGEKILAYQAQMVHDLKELVAIPSVVSPALPGKPFGEGSARALACVLRMAQALGFETVNVDNYAGHAVYGQGQGYADVLCHVDVVPAGTGWESDPFTLVEKDGKLYGRGTADDKGAAVVALYCLKALKDAGVQTKRRVRVVFGGGEEVASDDIARYYESQPLPDFGFTPDSEYGICNREKGILRLDFAAQTGGTALRSLRAGEVVNAVPSHAEAVVNCSGEQEAALRELAPACGDFHFMGGAGEELCIASEGVASHAMQPQAGVNAASRLLDLLGKVLSKEELGPLPSFLLAKVGLEYDGASMGLRQADAPSGPLTLNLGLLRIDETAPCASVDIRYPVTADGAAIFAKTQQQAAAFGVNCTRNTENKPLYLPEDSALIHLLQGAYQEVMGQPASVYATGGGTYAREMQGRGVAFGPFFQDEPDRRLHNVGEHIELARFLQHAQICLQAMYRMATAQ